VKGTLYTAYDAIVGMSCDAQGRTLVELQVRDCEWGYDCVTVSGPTVSDCRTLA
jgi:hypothetical protein